MMLVFALAMTTLVFGQDATRRFEVATVKLSPPPSSAALSINLGTFQNGRLTFGNVTLNDLLIFAYGLPSKEQLAGMEWTDRVRFDIEGLTPPETPQDELRLMVRQLLIERLHLVTRWEPRTTRYLALVASKGGPKLGQVPSRPCRQPKTADESITNACL